MNESDSKRALRPIQLRHQLRQDTRFNHISVEVLQRAATRTPTPKRFQASRQRLLQSGYARVPIRVHRKCSEETTRIQNVTSVGTKGIGVALQLTERLIYDEANELDSSEKALWQPAEGSVRLHGLPASNDHSTTGLPKHPQFGRSHGRPDIYALPIDDEDKIEEQVRNSPKQLRCPPQRALVDQITVSADCIKAPQEHHDAELFRDMTVMRSSTIPATKTDWRHTVQPGNITRDFIENSQQVLQQVRLNPIDECKPLVVKRVYKISKTSFQTKTTTPRGSSTELSLFKLPEVRDMSPRTKQRLFTSPTCSDGFDDREACKTGRKIPTSRSRSHRNILKVNELQMTKLKLVKSRPEISCRKIYRTKQQQSSLTMKTVAYGLDLDPAADDDVEIALPLKHNEVNEKAAKPRQFGNLSHQNKPSCSLVLRDGDKSVRQLLMIQAPAPQNGLTDSGESGESTDSNSSGEDQHKYGKEDEDDDEDMDVDVDKIKYDEKEDAKCEEHDLVDDKEDNPIKYVADKNGESSLSHAETTEDDAYSNEKPGVEVRGCTTNMDDNNAMDYADEEEPILPAPMYAIWHTELSEIYGHQRFVGAKPATTAREEQEIPWRPRKPISDRYMVELRSQVVDDGRAIRRSPIKNVACSARNLLANLQRDSIDFDKQVHRHLPSEIPETQPLFTVHEGTLEDRK